MKRRFSLPVLTATAALSLAAPAADAAVYIRLEQSGFATEDFFESSAGFAKLDNHAFGNFESVTVSVTGQPLEPLPGLLDSFTIAINNDGDADAGTLTVYVTSTGNTTPVGQLRFTSSFAANNLTQGWMETLETYLNPGDGIFATEILLGSGTFATTGSKIDTADADAAAPYSVTGVYRITAPTIGRTNAGLTLEATQIPEPASLALLGAALAGFGIFARYRRRSA